MADAGIAAQETAQGVHVPMLSLEELFGQVNGGGQAWSSREEEQVCALIALGARNSVRARIIRSARVAARHNIPGQPADDASKILRHSLRQLSRGGYSEDVATTPLLVVPNSFLCPPAASASEQRHNDAATAAAASPPRTVAAPAPAPPPRTAVRGVSSSTSSSGVPPVSSSSSSSAARTATSTATPAASSPVPAPVPAAAPAPAASTTSSRLAVNPGVSISVDTSTPIFAAPVTQPFLLTARTAQEAVAASVIRLRPMRLPAKLPSTLHVAAPAPAAVGTPAAPTMRASAGSPTPSRRRVARGMHAAASATASSLHRQRRRRSTDEEPSPYQRAAKRVRRR